jgi:hypothetical protein
VHPDLVLRRRVVALVALASVAIVGCGDARGTLSGGGNGGECRSFVWFRGHTYLGRHAAVVPEPGPVVGEAVYPSSCLSFGQSAPPGERIKMTSVNGVDPDIAVAQEGFPDLVYVRDDVDRPPPALVRAFTPLRCDPDLAPVRLQGTWLGITGADGNAELDLLPPYDVELRVTRSSPPGYERADLTVRVPASLGQPLSHADVETSLSTGGEIDLIATCRGERFLATGVFVPVVNSAQS